MVRRSSARSVAGSRKARLAAAAVAPAIALGISATVFACTAIMGNLFLTPTSGAAGSVITTSVTGLKLKPATYSLRFTKALSTTGGDCMSFKGTNDLGTFAADRKGAWSNKTATIPANARRGTHGICGMELTPVKGQTGTTHQTFTVT